MRPSAAYLLLLVALFLGFAASVPRGAVAGPAPAAPEVTGEVWLNSPPLTLAALRGRIVLVEFWTFACWTCQNVEPHVKEWHQRFAGRGLTVIAVHSPELRREREVANVKRYVAAHDIHYPVVIDNAFATWQRYRNQAWPSLHLIDKRGAVRWRHVGEGAYDEVEGRITALLAEEVQ